MADRKNNMLPEFPKNTPWIILSHRHLKEVDAGQRRQDRYGTLHVEYKLGTTPQEKQPVIFVSSRDSHNDTALGYAIISRTVVKGPQAMSSWFNMAATFGIAKEKYAELFSVKNGRSRNWADHWHLAITYRRITILNKPLPISRVAYKPSVVLPALDPRTRKKFSYIQ